MIPKIPFGRTGHHSSRVIFGAAALGSMKQERADAILELLLEYDIDHIDTAASYGDSELRVGAWMGRHRESLARFAFDSVLLPYNFPMLAQPAYAADVAALLEECRAQDVAVQTIKAVARRRWTPDAPGRRFSWYEPLRDPAALRRAVHWVLARPGIFLNTTSDATLLRELLAAAAAPIGAPSDAAMRSDVAREAMAPLFTVGGSDEIGMAGV